MRVSDKYQRHWAELLRAGWNRKLTKLDRLALQMGCALAELDAAKEEFLEASKRYEDARAAFDDEQWTYGDEYIFLYFSCDTM